MTASLVTLVQRIVDEVSGQVSAVWSTLPGAAAVVVLVACVVAVVGLAAWRQGGRAGLSTAAGRLGAVAAAAGAGWLAAAVAGCTFQVFAAAAAVGCVGLGLAFSAKEAARGVLAAGAGLVCAFIATHVGASALVSLLIAAAATWVVATAAGATANTAVAATITAVFASSLGAGLTSSLVVDRLVAVLVGSVAGVAVSALPWTGTPKAAASRRVRALAADVAGVWQMVAAAMAGQSPELAGDALEESRRVADSAEEVRVQVSAAVGHMRWSPVSSASSSGRELARLGTAVCHGAQQANAAARALFDLHASGKGRSVTGDGPLFAAACAAADVYQGIADGQVGDRQAAELAERLDAAASAAAGRIRGSDADTGVLLLGSQVVAAAAASGSAMSPTVAVESDLPAVGDIVPPLPRAG